MVRISFPYAPFQAGLAKSNRVKKITNRPTAEVAKRCKLWLSNQAHDPLNQFHSMKVNSHRQRGTPLDSNFSAPRVSLS